MVANTSSEGHVSEDVEYDAASEFLYNSASKVFSWQNITLAVKDRTTKRPRLLVDHVSGKVRAGEMLAIMGPSGSGKTTLLNSLARRGSSSATREGTASIDGEYLSGADFRKLTSYVEQEDALIGSLTVRETVDFSARLSLPASVSAKDRKNRVDRIIQAFGLKDQSHTLIGTPLRKGISGGQKRRTSVASHLITNPRILFLDEPTSGLDSVASFEIVNYLRTVARQYNLLVIASIHQPSTSTFNLFEKLLLLSQGKTCYYGSIAGIKPYFAQIGFPIPLEINPAEHLLELTNTDFATDHDEAQNNLNGIHSAWTLCEQNTTYAVEPKSADDKVALPTSGGPLRGPNVFSITTTIFKRMFIKSYRDVVVYGIRIAMYIGLAIMMGTIWLRLSTDQQSIQPFINAIFFGCAFMSFMAVAYIPAFLEDRATFVKDRANGLYGPTPFLIANFLVGLPYLFLISVIFSVIAYWLSNFIPSATAFFTWIMWLFLDLLAAEALVVLVASLFPIFVLSLAIVAFANGLWMSVGGFLVPPTILNVFYKYVFHYIDYQTYVFQGMIVNEFSRRVYFCAATTAPLTGGSNAAVPSCHCMYQTELAPQCLIAGSGVLDSFGYATGYTGTWVGILIGIIAGYRLLGWVALYFRGFK